MGMKVWVYHGIIWKCPRRIYLPLLMYGRKPWKKWTAIYWFVHQVYSAVIRGWILQCMKRLENWWLSGSEIHLEPILYMFLPISPYVSSCFTYCFPSFFGYFPCFPWCFSLFPILSLNAKKTTTLEDDNPKSNLK